MPRTTRLFAVLALSLAVLGACGGGGEAAQSTTLPPVTTATPTTTLPPTTTTTSPPTTTTVAPTTTTTTSSPPSAEPALAATPYGVLGWRDGDWVSTPSTGDLPDGVAGATFDVVTLDAQFTVAAERVWECETTGTAMIDFGPGMPEAPRMSGAVAVLDPSWELVPRPVTLTDPPDDRLQTALDHLSGQGVDEDEPPFAQYVEADLDGDGTVEGLLALSRGEPLAGPGDYSLVMLFGAGDPLVVAESYGVAENPYVLNHVVAAVADLDGDGTMEMVLDTDYYEGSGSVAYAYDAAGAVAQVLSGGCGA